MTVTLAEAHRIMEAAIAKARELNVEISVVVCDADGRLVGLNRMDGVFAEANRGAIGKAIAATTSGHPSGEADGSVDIPLRAHTVIGEGAPMIRRGGGLPIIRGDVVEGACGVSGANSNEEDERCTRAGVASISAE